MKYIRKFKEWINKRKVDLLVYTSFLILVFTTLSINIHAGLYLLAVLLLVIAVIVSRYRKGGR